MTAEAMAGLEEIKTNAILLEQQMLDVAATVPDLPELLGPQFFKTLPHSAAEYPVQEYLLLGDYLQQLGQKIGRVRVALLNVKFWEEYPWPEGLLKLLASPKNL